MGALSCRAAKLAAVAIVATILSLATPAFAGTSDISAADTAWMIVATADVFGVHGVGGMTGILLTGVFATASIGGTSGLIEGNPNLVLIQLYGVIVTLGWSGGMTYALLKLVGLFVPLRVSLQQELEGLDISQHGEALQ
jgi:ammonia channel protein AmtB